MSGQGTLIPDLTLADVLASDDELVVEQSGATKRFLASELSRHVMTTAAGGNGAEDGANTWCKICDISLNTGTDADLPISLKFLASQQANGGSMDAEVFTRQTGGVGIAGTSYINVTAIHGVDTFSPDSLKLISNAEGSAQLWLRKDSNFNTIYVYEIGKGGFNEAATPISYNNNAAWQSATPSGAVNITSDWAYSDTGYRMLHVRDEKSTGVSGGSSSAGNNVRTINTTVFNNIDNASFSSNQVTLPAGTYDVEASAPAFQSARHRLRLYNITDSSYEVVGSAEYNSAADSVQTTASLKGRFTITATKTFDLRHYIQTAKTTDGLGVACSDGLTEVYAQLKFIKVK